ncbi:T9SS type A sorting domain-containing protein [Ulvibacter antarcticus]|uniref:Putative secreted protein (Por secretion system target) n=1 Tax=Ulvibacter antarcticus TaxID=442714 RepID=A0A3L9YW34_9FLAO|nr:T9SS type A sorting domain-containing protein [Ulvibacter antarcticus]RMA64524.1 putative secreted protein (Por secretion system target) [Ulvibacter antarcticus]
MRILLFIVSVLFTTISNAQAIIPMLDEANVWSVDFFAWTGGDIRTDQIQLGETAVYNGNTYHQVGTYENTAYVREENGIVYVNNEIFSNDDKILYDFNLELGDSFTLTASSNLYSDGPATGLMEFQVTNVETQFIAGMDRKIIELKDDLVFPLFTEYWIEGIGSVKGFDHHHEFVDSGYTGLACFTTNGETYFFNGATACDNTVLTVEDFSSEKIILSPNPLVNTSILNFPSEVSINQMKIYDITGRLVRSETVSKEYVSINAMDFRSGLYFYQVFSAGQIIKTDKFIVK